MSAPKSVVDVIRTLQEERRPLAARLDAIDLAIENLNRIYGINGTPQPLPLERASKRRPVQSVMSDSDAEERRELLLAAIVKSDVGLTLAELRKRTPKMDGKARSNALQTLKTAGQIARAGNAWVKAS